ncbi:UNVERIFIED_CONTAM: hypothetical protein HDU68_001324 [Siphonaria sp. JEL0065]|nr:hypothetical protein HDU68_001324 [Siphonaria sp. JEL0065]
MTSEVKFSQSAAVTRCRNIKETKLKAQYALAKLADEEVTIYTANLESSLHRLRTQLAENCSIEDRQAEAARDVQISWERKQQLNKLVDKLTAIKSLLRFQEEEREREAAFKSSARQKSSAFQARSARMEQRHTAERNELSLSQQRLADTVSHIRAIEIRSIKDKNKARRLKRENEIQAQQTAMRQQKESEFLRELQLGKVRQMGELNDLETSNMEEIEDLATQHRLEEFELMSKQLLAESELVTNLEIQKHKQESMQMYEKQKAVQVSHLRAQRKQAAAIAKGYAVAARNREKMLISDNPIIKSDEDEVGGKTDNQNDETSMNLADEDIAIIKISGERSNLGIVSNTNANFDKYFGYQPGECVGKNINFIVPSPFAELHDGFLKKYLDTGASRVIDVLQQVMGLHRDGHLIPIVLCVKHNTDPNGKRAFAGFIKPVKESTTSGFVIFDTATLRIRYTTKNVEELFNYRNSKSGGSSVVGDLLPGFSEESLKQVSGGGFQVEVKRGDVVYSCRLKGDRMQSQEFSLYICRLTFRKRSESSSHLHEEDDDAVDLPMTFYEDEEGEEGHNEENKDGAKDKEHADGEKDLALLTEAGNERLRAITVHHKMVFSELKRQHKSSISQKTKEHRRRISELLKDHEEENEQLKIDQAAIMKELLDTQLQSEELRADTAVSQNLLGMMLPAHIMEKIELGVQPEPESFSCVSLFFTDIAGFKKLVGAVSPVKILELLNVLYTKFDEVILRYPQLYKVESVSDTYMVATGLSVSPDAPSKEYSECAVQALKCCAELQALVKSLDLSNIVGSHKIELRIGIHSGTVNAVSLLPIVTQAKFDC